MGSTPLADGLVLLPLVRSRRGVSLAGVPWGLALDSSWLSGGLEEEDEEDEDEEVLFLGKFLEFFIASSRRS